MTYQPLALIAELTHRCPLKCVYCSNPIEMKARETELAGEVWQDLFKQAAGLGIMQLHMTGGEPLLRPDLPELIRAGREAGLYINLITSGMGLTDEKLQTLVDAGLDHVQLSFQDVEVKSANSISGVRSHLAKLEAAKVIKRKPVAFTANIVVHRRNVDRLEQMIEMAAGLGADKLEVAHVQYNGWAFKNREALLPTRAQLDCSVEAVKAASARHQGKMRIDFVVPDYYAKYPKACMGGWAQKTILVDPSGVTAPCHSAGILPGLELPSVREHSLEWIWRESPAFRKFRGEDWMQAPCRECPRRDKDFGGCRCQAFLVTGDPNATDPVCSLSPRRGMIDGVLAGVSAEDGGAGEAQWTHRQGPR